MNRKSKRKKQRAASVPTPSKILFTFSAARMLKDALRVMDEAFTRNTKPLPNLDLGRETLEHLKNKIDDLLQCEDWNKETPFDANELYILYAAIHMYLVDLSLDGKQQLMPTCLHLCKQLRAIIEMMPTKEIKATRSD